MLTNPTNYNKTVILYNRVECEEQNNAIKKLKEKSNALIYIINKANQPSQFEVIIPAARQKKYEYKNQTNSLLLSKDAVPNILKMEIAETKREEKYLRIVYIPEALKEDLCKVLQDHGYLTFFKN
jgi:hypothetical protein